MEIIKFDIDKSDLDYQNKDYKVYHVRPNDASCDLLLLASNKTEELLIPCDRDILKKNIPYFVDMFSDSSNRIESKNNEHQSGSQTTGWKDRRKSSRRKLNMSTIRSLKIGNVESNIHVVDSTHHIIERVIGSPDLFDEKAFTENQIKLCTNKHDSDEDGLLTLKITVDDPTIFGKFLQDFYNGSFEVTNKNCVDYYKLMVFLRFRNECLDSVIDFIKSNLDLKNI